MYLFKDDVESLSNKSEISRLYYTFRERNLISKVGAGEYGLQVVPQKWHKIIKESMRLQKDNKK